MRGLFGNFSLFCPPLLVACHDDDDDNDDNDDDDDDDDNDDDDNDMAMRIRLKTTSNLASFSRHLSSSHFSSPT